MLSLVSDDVEHHVNQGEVRRGRAAFAEFCSHMGVSYREELRDMVVFLSEDGSRAAAEFMVHGEYLQTDPGLPEARGAGLCSARRVVLCAEGGPDYPRDHLL